MMEVPPPPASRRFVTLDDPAHPINGDFETRRAYLHRKRQRDPEKLREYERRRAERRKAERTALREIGEVGAPGGRRGGPAPRTLAQGAAVHAYKRGYRITDAGELRNPAGKTVPTPPRGPRTRRTFGVYAPVPETRTGRGARSGKAPVTVDLSIFAAFCRFGAAAFQPGACTVYLNGDHTDLSRGNAVLSDRSAVAHLREEGRNHPRADWRAPLAPLAGKPPAAGRRRMTWEAVLGYRRRWAGGNGASIASLAREAGVDGRAMAMALRGQTYREAEFRPMRMVKRRSVDETTIRAFRFAVQERGVTVREAVKRLGKTERWGYYVLSGRLYPTVSTEVA